MHNLTCSLQLIEIACSMKLVSLSHALYWSSSNLNGINFETFLKDNKFKYFFPWVNNMHDYFDMYTCVTHSVINEPVTWFIKKKKKQCKREIWMIFVDLVIDQIVNLI